MSHVQIEIHKNVVDVIQLDLGIEVQIVDVEAKAVVVFHRDNSEIAWHVLGDNEVSNLRNPA